MKKLLFLVNLLILKCYAASELYAGNEDINEVLNNNMYTPSYYKMFLGLAFVIGLVYLTGMIYQKLTKVKIADTEIDKYKPEIISTTNLGQNKNLHVVKVMDEYVLIGSTQNTVSFLKNLTEDRTYKGYWYDKNC